MKSRSILLVDDDRGFARHLHRALNGSGYTIAHAADASAARTLLDRTGFDVLLVDLNLGDENGIELIRQVCTAKRRPKIIAITASLSDLHLEIARYVGADAAIRKPTVSGDVVRDGAEWIERLESVLAPPESNSSSA